VRASVHDLSGLSVHADREGLVEWATSGAEPPGAVYVVHGEEAASEALRDALAQKLDCPVVVPRDGERVRI
jgi:metallo-beta-lactamase family protein